MKRRKFGVSFEKDIVYIKYIFGHYEIKYSDIEKIVYIKRSCILAKSGLFPQTPNLVQPVHPAVS